MSRPRKWNEMVSASKNAHEGLNDFSDDKAIIWADSEMRNYARAMLLLKDANSDWASSLTDDDEAFVATMIRRAESS